MAWSWSHTTEAYDNALQNLKEQPSEWLRDCWAEIKAGVNMEDSVSEFDLDLDLYMTIRMEADSLSVDLLIKDIWESACNIRTCDNGGFNAWMCPFGCHTVSFDKEEI